MADTKITGLTNFDSSNTPFWPPAPASDVIPIVDVSDPTMAGSGTTKKISINNLLSSSPTATGALTVTGLVTAGSATITGALTVDTTTLVVDATNDRVGIGTATPGSPFHLYANAGGIAQIESINASGPYVIWRTSGTSFGDLGSRLGIEGLGSNTDFMLASRASDLIFGVGSQEKARINSTGNIVMKNANTGIDFSINSNAGGATSEILNDYEEGTFTPTISSGVTGITFGTQTGVYTKIGRLVSIMVQFTTTGSTRNGSPLIFAGLPFAATSFSGGVISYSSSGFIATAAGNKPNLLVSGSTIEFYNSDGTAFNGTTIAANIFDVRFSATYSV